MPEIKYAKAVKRLEEIVEGMEREDIDVDELAARVKEAVGLIQSCRKRIEKAEMDVQKVVDQLASQDE